MLGRLLLPWLGLTVAPTVDLTWSGPSGCPSGAEVEAAIVERLVARDFEGHAEVKASVSEAPPGWVVSVTVEGSERSVDVNSCGDAPDAVALVVAIATVASPAVPPAPPEPEPEAEPEPEVKPEPEVEPTPTVRRAPLPDNTPPPERSTQPPSAPLRTRHRLGLALGVGGAATYGALPGVGGAVAGDLGLLWRRAFVRAGALHRVHREHRLEEDPELGGAFRITTGRAQAGPRYAVGRLELAAAGGAELGALWARGVGASPPVARRRLWAAASVGGQIGVEVTRWLALSATIDGVFPLLRPSFSLAGRVRVAEVGPASVRCGLRLEFRPEILRISDRRGQ